MIGFLVENWRQVRVAPERTTFVQPQSLWVDLAGFEDVVLWLDTKSALAPGDPGDHLRIHFETAPRPQEELFVSMDTVVLDPTPASNPVVTKFVLDDDPTIPLARWFRWRLEFVGTPAARWGALFRLAATA